VPSIVDGDIGQSDLAPPSVIGAATLGQQIADLRDVSATTFEFVGNVSPHGLERLISQRLASIVTRSCSGGQLCIVNTDGYVDNGGILYKKMIASELQPKIIVFLGKDRILMDALGLGPWQILHAKSSTQAQKSRTVRVRRRQDQFARYVGSGQLRVDPSNIIFIHLDMTYSFQRLQAPTISQLEPENMRQMFVGLGSGGDIIGFGVIADMTRERLTVVTDIRNFDTVYLSDIKLV